MINNGVLFRVGYLFVADDFEHGAFEWIVDDITHVNCFLRFRKEGFNLECVWDTSGHIAAQVDVEGTNGMGVEASFGRPTLLTGIAASELKAKNVRGGARTMRRLVSWPPEGQLAQR